MNLEQKESKGEKQDVKILQTLSNKMERNKDVSKQNKHERHRRLFT